MAKKEPFCARAGQRRRREVGRASKLGDAPGPGPAHASGAAAGCGRRRCPARPSPPAPRGCSAASKNKKCAINIATIDNKLTVSILRGRRRKTYCDADANIVLLQMRQDTI